MAEWVTHLMVADMALEQYSWLCRHEFCVGNIAPDCNIPNEDWTQFTPKREVTHWMMGTRKSLSDCARFQTEYIEKRMEQITSRNELSFLLGYYAHLITDAELQRRIRDEERVMAAWKRINKIPSLMKQCKGMPENWDTVKAIMDRKDRTKDFTVIECEYLNSHPNSGYFTEIMNLTTFPDYIDYLPPNAIPNKIKQMLYMPTLELGKYPFIAFSREEYMDFIDSAVRLVLKSIEKMKSYFECSNFLIL